MTLRRTTITDRGLKELTRLPDLSQLFLSYTAISDAGMKELASAQKLTRLALDSMASDVWTGHVAHTNGFFSTTL